MSARALAGWHFLRFARMNTLRICPSCHAALPADSPQTLCPACLAKRTPEDVISNGPFTPPKPEALSPYFPQLEILDLLGFGGMGSVYRARQRGLDRTVALKILPLEVSSDRSFAERFAREARLLARLSHPNIITVFDLGQSGPYFYFLMEFVDGANLRQLLESRQLDSHSALAFMPQICEALEYAHQEGVVHRDIKPENILIDKKGRVKVADFGLSKLLRPDRPEVQITQSSQVLGTFHYIAPEQFGQGLPVDERVDVYALGVVLYEMLTGELPIGRYELPSQKAAVDRRFDALVLRALERNPNRRYQQVSEIRLEVEAITGMVSKLTPEVSRRLSYEYRTKASLFGLPLIHVALGINPATGRKRTATGIIALGSSPRGLFAFGDIAVGLVACGLFSLGVVSISVVAIGVLAVGSLAVGLVFAMGGLAMAPVVMGGAAIGYYASGMIALGKHVSGGNAPYDPEAARMFGQHLKGLPEWIFRLSMAATPVFLAIGFVPSFMAMIAARRARKLHDKVAPKQRQ